MKTIKIIIALVFTFFLYNRGSAQTTLTKKTVLEKQVTLKIPTDFKKLAVEEINQKYERGRRPTIVFVNNKGDVTITLELKSTQISQESLPRYQANYGFMFNKYVLDKTKASNDLITINNHVVGFLKLKMPTRTGVLYTLMFYTNIGNQMLTGSFSCPINEQQKWKNTADEILMSLVVK